MGTSPEDGWRESSRRELPGGAGRVGRARLLDYLVRPLQQRLRIVRPSAFAVLTLITRSAPLLYVQAVGGWRSAAVLLKVYARWMDTGLGIPGQPAATPAQPRQVAGRLTS
jgi:hypothetical protein